MGKSPIRVMYVLHSAQWGGAETSLYDLIERLREDVHPIVCQLSDVEFEGIFEGLDVEVINVPFTVYNCRSPKSEFYRSGRLQTELQVAKKWVCYNLPLTLFFCHLFRQHKPDLVHVNDHVNYNRPEILAAAMAGIPCVSHLRGVLNRLGWTAPWVARLVSRFIAVSKAVKESAVQSGLPGDRIRVVYEGIKFPPQLPPYSDKALTRLKLGLEPDGVYVVSLGRLVAIKGVARLVQIWPEISRSYPRARLLVVGDGPEKDHLEKSVESKGLSQVVKFVGQVSNVWDYLRASDVYVHTVVVPEAFGRSVAEAMGIGLAVVVPDWDTFFELLEPGKSGLFYPRSEDSALRNVLMQVLADSALRERLGREASRRARSLFTVEQYAEEVHSVYHEILGRR